MLALCALGLTLPRASAGDGLVEILTKPTATPYSELGALGAPTFTSWLFYLIEPGNIPGGGGIG